MTFSRVLVSHLTELGLRPDTPGIRLWAGLLRDWLGAAVADRGRMEEGRRAEEAEVEVCKLLAALGATQRMERENATIVKNVYVGERRMCW